ncbi:MAG: nicotinamide riboside transporter PnuC [Caldimonas sp.]
MADLVAAAGPLFANAFVAWNAPVTWIELLAFALAILMVIFNIRVNVLGWPLAIASSLLYFLVFWKSRLYGDASLQIFFATVAGWGWWQWLRGTDDSGHALQVRALGWRGRLVALVALALAWPAVALFLRRYTDTDVPWWDAFPTTASVLGQWLLGRKYVENWPTWIVVNIVGVALFAYKGLWLTVLLYAVFAVMSVVGWRAWLRLAPGPGPIATAP